MKAPLPRKKALYLIDADFFELVFPPAVQESLESNLDFVAPPQTASSIAENPELLREVEVIVGGWGIPKLDEKLLKHAPKLEMVFFAGGSIRPFTSELFWERGIRATSAYAANSIPVAEYTLGTILLSLKHFWKFARLSREGIFDENHSLRDLPGGYQSKVGFVSFGMIARRTRQLLKSFDLRCYTYCPFLSAEEAAQAEVELLSLEAIFKECDVISLHTPALPETEKMIRGEHFASMRQGATFINTARGSVVHEEEMIEVLRVRPDLTAILDVTYPEPAAPDSPLRSLPNVVLTPHIAGSTGRECGRLGAYAAEEVSRFVKGSPLHFEINYQQSLRLA